MTSSSEFLSKPLKSKYKPSNQRGIFYFLFCLLASVLGLFFSLQDNIVLWGIGQLTLAIALCLWFILMHEAGHKTLFQHAILNEWAGHVSGFFAGTPFIAWKKIHFRHHKWTGWQDLDATTATLVPRSMKPSETVIINFCWKFGIPLFALTYQFNNFWNYFRIQKYVSKRNHNQILGNLVGLFLVYLIFMSWVGVDFMLQCIVPAWIVSLVLKEILILSQHTHIPSQLSHQQLVQPVPPLQQEKYTRSLKFPKIISILLLNFNMHELHHMYPQVPGYYLHQIGYQSQNDVSVIQWLQAVRSLSGTDFLFKNRLMTGFKY